MSNDIKTKISDKLDTLIRRYEHQKVTPQESQVYDNQLQIEKLKALKLKIDDNFASELKALDRIQNLIRSVEFNHHPQGQAEKIFFECFNKEFMEELQENNSSNTEQVSRVYIHFSGTGMPVFAKNCANEEIIDKIENEHYQIGLVYRVAGVGSSKDGQWDPDSHFAEGTQCFRKPDKTNWFNPLRVTKIKKGQGVCRAAMDAACFVENLSAQGRLTEYAEIIILGHSRGSVEALLLPHLLLNNEKTKQYHCKSFLNEPVPGGLIEDVHIEELREKYPQLKNKTVEDLLYEIPENVDKCHISFARHEMRPKFTPVDLGQMKCSKPNQLIARLKPGYHNTPIFATHHVDLHTYGAMAQRHLRTAGVDTDKRAKGVREDYIHEALEFFSCSVESKDKAQQYLQDFSSKPLLNPGYNALQGTQFRDLSALEPRDKTTYWDINHERSPSHSPETVFTNNNPYWKDTPQKLQDNMDILDTMLYAFFPSSRKAWLAQRAPDKPTAKFEIQTSELLFVAGIAVTAISLACPIFGIALAVVLFAAAYAIEKQEMQSEPFDPM